MRKIIIGIVLVTCFANIMFAADTLSNKNIIAIMDFKNSGAKEYDNLQSSLPNMLATTFASSEKIQVVERSQIEKIVSEMKVGLSGLIDAEQAAKIGKMAGAKMVVLGTYTNLGSSIRIDVKVVNVETGIIIPKATARVKADKIENVDVAIDQLASSLLTNLTGEDITKTTPQLAKDNLPEAPVLSLPANNSTNIPIPYTITWNASSKATSYILQISRSEFFDAFVYNGPKNSTSFGMIYPIFNTGTVYYWRVKAVNSYGTSDWSSIWSFTTDTALGLLNCFPNKQI